MPRGAPRARRAPRGPPRRRNPGGSGGAAPCAAASALALLARLSVERQLLAQDVGEGELPALALAFHVRFDLLALLAAPQRLDREADALLARVDVDHLRLYRIAHLEERARLVDALARELGDVDEALDPLLELHEHPEVGDARHRAAHARAGRVAPRHRAPRVGGELLDAERDALVVDVDAEHHGLHLVALLVELGGVLHLARPVQVGDVHEPVDPLGHLHEEAEVGEALHLAPDPAAHRVVRPHELPGVGLGLLEAERDAVVDAVDVEHLDLDLLAHLEDLRGMRHPLRPRHLRDVDQPFEPALELAAHARADRKALRRRGPRIGADLLHAERDPLALRVVLEHHHAHPLADRDHLRGVPDPPPGHVGDVQQPVDAAEVDERPVVGDVLDGPLEDDAFLEDLERLLLERRPLALEHGAARDHDVAAGAVELEDRKPSTLADVAVEVARGAEIGVRARQERRHPDIHLEPALYLADDRALDDPLAVIGALDVAPDLELERLLAGEHDLAGLGVVGLEEDVDLVALADRERAVAVGELVPRDVPLGLVPDVDRHRVRPDAHHPAAHHVAGLRALEAPLEERGEVLLGAGRRAGLLGDFGHHADTPWGQGIAGVRGNRSLIPPSDDRFKGARPHGTVGARRARAMRSIVATTAASGRCVVSSTTASAAARSGASARLASRASRAASSRASAAASTASPRAASSAARRRARSSGAAVRKNLTAASGTTTVPMSRPSMTTSPAAASARCTASSRARTAGRTDTREASSPARAVRMAAVRSRPSTSSRSPRATKRSGATSAASAWSSSRATPRSAASRPTARYMAPVST